jgi:hypothetical protein
MAAMSESLVDLSYRGLALGKRIKLTQVRPASGYLEMPTPMPVGTTIAITTDDGLQLEATVAEIHEQVGGSEKVPGMLVKPNLAESAADAWWRARASAAEPRPEKSAPPADAQGKVTVMSPRMTGEQAIPEVMDDGKNTAVMSIAEPTIPSRPALDVRDTDPNYKPPRDTNPGLPTMSDSNPGLPAVQDDGKSTMMMDAVDLAALGLSSGQSGEMAAVKPEDYADDDAGSSKPDMNAAGGGKAKKKRKRR